MLNITHANAYVCTHAILLNNFIDAVVSVVKCSARVHMLYTICGRINNHLCQVTFEYFVKRRSRSANTSNKSLDRRWCSDHLVYSVLP